MGELLGGVSIGPVAGAAQGCCDMRLDHFIVDGAHFGRGILMGWLWSDSPKIIAHPKRLEAPKLEPVANS